MNEQTNEQRKQSQVKASLHNHSIFSGYYSCTHSKPKVWFREAFKQLASPEGIVAITDCESEYLFKDLPLLLPDEYRLIHYEPRLAIIKDEQERTLYFPRGIEFHVPGGHIIGIGCLKCRKIYPSPIDNAKQITEQGGIAIAAHPFAPEKLGGFNRKTLDYLVENKLVHAIEGHNSQCRNLVLHDLKYINHEAKKYAELTRIPAIATCDSRHPKDVSTAVFLPHKPVRAGSGEEFVEWLKSQIALSRVPDEYFKMNIEGYTPLHIILRTLGVQNKLSPLWPWKRNIAQKTTLGEAYKIYQK